MTDEPREDNLADPTKQYDGPQPDPVEGNDDDSAPNPDADDGTSATNGEETEE